LIETHSLQENQIMKQFFTLTIIFVITLLSACNQAGPTADTPVPETAAQPDVEVGLLLSNLSNPFFVSIEGGAKEAAGRSGVMLVVMDAEDNIETQEQQVKELIDRKVAALLINPVDSVAIGSSIEAANAANIPVITVDRSAATGQVIAHIASDNVSGGEMAGNYLAEILEEQGQVVELEGAVGTSAAIDRGAGFNNAMQSFTDIEIIARETANFNREDGKAVFARILADNPQIDGVFAHNDDMILGAIEAAQDAGRADDILFVGFDAVDDAVAALEGGTLNATIAQQPAEMGRLGIEMVSKYLNGEELPESVPVDLALLTR
jgi:ribose transport system substrate-binding protein